MDRWQRMKQLSVAQGAPVRPHGVLTEWNDERGYGFITPSDGGPKVFLHVHSLLPAARRPVVGEEFFYELTTDDKGRPRAEEAFQKGFDEWRSLPFPHSFFSCLAHGCWFLALIPPLLLAARTGSLVGGLIAAFVQNSLLTILFYREDKYFAQYYKHQRIPEFVLHLWELLYGWPGALYAQQAFCHKRRKISYMLAFWFCVIVNVAALFLLFRYADPAEIGAAFGETWREIVSFFD